MQTVNFDAVVKNAVSFKKILKKSRLCAVLKNDAYGHGIVRVASCLADLADFFAVGSLSEAIEVSHFSPDVLILLPQDSRQTEAAVRNGFVLTLDSFDTLQTIVNNIPLGKHARVHIKIDTGMNRLGFRREQLWQLSECLTKSPQIAVEGIFSHFWGETDDTRKLQWDIFLQSCAFLERTVDRPLVRHIANTSAVVSGDFNLDMARVGLGLYGYGAPNLVPAKTVTADVIAVHRVCQGETVGYGGTHTFKRDSRVAVLDCGYAKGFPRALCGAKVKLGGKLCPVVGNVCMAMMAVDVGDSPVRVGDRAVLLGEGVNSANSQVIVYELLCNLR